MWRFILITFAFLGWSFYELSGGADYEPRTNSIQARALLDDVRPVARPVRTHVAQLSDTGGVATATDTATPLQADTPARVTAPRSDGDNDGGARITLASASADSPATHTISLPIISAQPVDIVQQLGAAQPRITGLTLRGLSDDTASTDGTGTTEQNPRPARRDADIRTIAGSAVNMRAGPGTQYDRIARLVRGNKVAVLQDPGNGWLKLRVIASGRVGWMADSLVTASAN